MNVLTNQIIHMNLNDQVNDYDQHNDPDTSLGSVTPSWVNRDPNEITSLIETVKNDYQSDIILSLFTNLSNKMYLVDHREDSFKIELDLLGSKKKSASSRQRPSLGGGTLTREKYTVIFNKSQSNFTCNCKDFVYRAKSRDIVCKHITFIICKVLGIYDHTFFETKKLKLIYQKRMARIIGGSGIWHNNEISVKHINYKFNKNTVRKLNTEETCPICCDAFSNVETISCPECHQFVHKSCIDVWIETSKTCIYCRNSIWSNYIKDIENL